METNGTLHCEPVSGHQQKKQTLKISSYIFLKFDYFTALRIAFKSMLIFKDDPFFKTEVITESKHSGHKHLVGEKAIVKSRHTEVEKCKSTCLMHPIRKNILYTSQETSFSICHSVENNLNSQITTLFKTSEEHS